MAHDRARRFRHQPLRIARAQRAHLFEREARRDVAVDEVMRRRLVGDHVGHDAARDDLRIDVGGVTAKADGEAAALVLRGADHRQRGVEGGRLRVEIFRLHALGDARRIDLDAEDGGFRHGAGERLRAAHAAKAGREHEPPGEIAAEVALRDPHEDLVGPLDHAL